MDELTGVPVNAVFYMAVGVWLVLNVMRWREEENYMRRRRQNDREAEAYRANRRARLRGLPTRQALMEVERDIDFGPHRYRNSDFVQEDWRH